ncbi:hypothetical protein G3M48_009236 [Beauveria asiatica]|uniref:Uncharacterized protein n=1 Tax=Beauveria asiatica TaxID=1069075 RepID=A0AAW0S2K7_9HYPO
MAGGSYGDGSLHSDTIVRWNMAKELPSKEASNEGTPEAPHLKHGVRFNLPDFGFNQDDSRIDWLSNESEDQGASIDETYLSPDHMSRPRADSVATHILDSSLARADHVLWLRKQARQERRALKESGDYLGVQGINPETGRMDVETPTDSDESQPSFGAALEQQSRANRMVATFDPEMTEKEKKKMLLKAREDELRLLEKSKQEAEEAADQLMWRRHTQEWSIVKDSGANEPSDQQPTSPAENASDPRVNKADCQRVGAWVEGSPQQTAASLPIIEHQESLHMTNDDGFLLTTDRTCQDMSKSKDESVNLDPTETDKENQSGHNLGVQGRFVKEVPNATTKRLEARDESAYTRITTTTGSMQQEDPPMGDYNGLAVKKQEKPTAFWPEKTSNDIPKAEGTPANIPNDITSPELMNCQKDAKLCALKITRAANRLQLRQKKADIVTPSIGSKALTANANLVDALLAPRMALTVAYTGEREKKSREAVAAVQ